MTTPAGPTTPSLEVQHVSKSFPVGGGGIGRRAESLQALVDVSLTVPQAQAMGIVGESGCGKSTLARVMVRLLAPDAGRVLLHGQELPKPGKHVGGNLATRLQMVFQDPYSSLNPRRRIGEAIEEPLTVHGIVPKGSVAQERDRLLDKVGLSPDIARRLPRELSGGQRQRVSIARALSVRPDVLVADEAVSSLDVSVRAQILNLLADLREEMDLTLVFISHDLSVVDHISHSVAVMYLGRVVELGPTSSVMGRGAHPYTRALVDAIPQPSVTEGRDEPALRGELPSAVRPPSGCVFRTRCPIAQDICSEAVPTPIKIEDGHWAACHFAGATDPATQQPREGTQP